MGRFAFVLLAFAAAINPTVRAWAAPHVEWALDPVYGQMAHYRMDSIARALEGLTSAGRELPSSRTLPDFLAGHYGRPEAALDPWGSRLYMARDAWTLRVASPGPDRTRFTEDDILSRPLQLPD